MRKLNPAFGPGNLLNIISQYIERLDDGFHLMQPPPTGIRLCRARPSNHAITICSWRQWPPYFGSCMLRQQSKDCLLDWSVRTTKRAFHSFHQQPYESTIAGLVGWVGYPSVYNLEYYNTLEPAGLSGTLSFLMPVTP